MPTVELLYFAGCPAYRRARQHVVAAMKAAGAGEAPTMVLVRNERDARALDFHGSPTVRVDGRDIDPDGLAKSPEVGLYSRSFAWAGKAFDAPPAEMVAAALGVRPR
jgi:hypothetical protein